jgi:Cytochrome P450
MWNWAACAFPRAASWRCRWARRTGTRQYAEPDAFDIFRERAQHISFGDGAHKCLGMHLARLEMRVLLNAVLDRLPGLRLDPDADDPAHPRADIQVAPEPARSVRVNE